ncbi:MAG: RNA-binding S4 domain-containing protein [Gammaproteobacteria bacterium]
MGTGHHDSGATSNGLMGDNRSQRIDKWLWCARFFKTRGQAAEAINGGKVHVDGLRVKPARLVRAGSRLEIRRGESQFDVTVMAVAARRGPAPEARALYEESPESVERRAADRDTKRIERLARPVFEGRPTKRDRRKLSDLKQSGD